MSKGSSYLFEGTTGQGQALIDEVIAGGNKISPSNVLLITRTEKGKIIWLEKGNEHSGYQHIITNHGSEFTSAGISYEELPRFILEAVHQNNIVGYQGKRNPRTVYEFVYHGIRHRIAVQVSENGYIVSANPRSMEE